jgi:hypothetical protein
MTPDLMVGLAVGVSLGVGLGLLATAQAREAPAVRLPGGESFVLRVGTGAMGSAGGRFALTALTVRKGSRGGRGRDRLILPPIPPESFVEVSLGRAPDPQRIHLVLGDETVSRRHALLRGEGGVWEVLPLQPTNPVRVNGRRLEEEGDVLKPGDVLQLGKQALRFDGLDRA